MRDLKRLAEEVEILLLAEGIDRQDRERALKSVSECVLPEACADAYLKYIYLGERDDYQDK